MGLVARGFAAQCFGQFYVHAVILLDSLAKPPCYRTQSYPMQGIHMISLKSL